MKVYVVTLGWDNDIDAAFSTEAAALTYAQQKVTQVDCYTYVVVQRVALDAPGTPATEVYCADGTMSPAWARLEGP